MAQMKWTPVVRQPEPRPVGMWAKASISRLPSQLGERGSGAGRQSRSFTYPQAFLVNLPRRAIAEALMLGRPRMPGGVGGVASRGVPLSRLRRSVAAVMLVPGGIYA
jgi:hypothetical protein